MKFFLGILIAVLAFPSLGLAHSELFFPKLLSHAEFDVTGLALVNPDNFAASVEFVLVSPEGVRLGRTQPPLQIPPRGQLAILVSQLFPDASSGGWIGAVSDAEGIQAFWLSYNASLTSLDGAEAAQLDTIGHDQTIPLAAGRSELNVVNPNGLIVDVNIRAYGESGLLETVRRTLNPFAGLQVEIAALFPATVTSQIRYLRLQTSQAPIASCLVIRDYLSPADSAVVAGANFVPRSTMIFPHVVNGEYPGGRYTTVIGVSNLSSSAQTIDLTYYPEAGEPRRLSHTLPAGGALRAAAEDLFTLPPGFATGWVHVAGTSAITGYAAYADIVAGGIAVVTAAAAEPHLFFSHIADGPPQWQTGLALVNPGNESANVEVYAITPAGRLIGSPSRFSLAPGGKIAKVIHELIPETRGVNGGFLYVRTTNNQTLHGMELFYTEDLKVLSNVSAGKLVQGVNFAPPQP